MKTWTPKAELYDFGRPFPEDAIKALIDESILNKNAKLEVFEPGCGTGRVLVPIATKYNNWGFIGLDSSASTLDVFDKKISTLHLENVELIEGLIPDAIPEKLFDLIVHSSYELNQEKK